MSPTNTFSFCIAKKLRKLRLGRSNSPNRRELSMALRIHESPRHSVQFPCYRDGNVEQQIKKASCVSRIFESEKNRQTGSKLRVTVEQHFLHSQKKTDPAWPQLANLLGNISPRRAWRFHIKPKQLPASPVGEWCRACRVGHKP